MGEGAVEEIIDLHEAAAMSGRPHDSLRKAAQRGGLRARKVGPGRRSVWVTTVDDLTRFLALSDRKRGGRA